MLLVPGDGSNVSVFDAAFRSPCLHANSYYGVIIQTNTCVCAFGGMYVCKHANVRGKAQKLIVMTLAGLFLTLKGSLLKSLQIMLSQTA